MSSSMTTVISVTFESIISRQIKFYLVLLFQLLSVFCSLLLFYQYSINRRQLKSLHNHAIVLLLITSFLSTTTSLPMLQQYLYNGYVTPSTDGFCSYWAFNVYTLSGINLFLMAFLSIERHLLIFKGPMMSNKKNQYFYHYLPILFCILYPFLFYLVVIYFYQCENNYDYAQLLCVAPCYAFTNIGIYDTIINCCLPIVFIFIFSSALVLRVVKQKRKLKLQPFKWKRDRKMTLQLLVITLVYCLLWTPMNACTLIETFFMVDTTLLQAQTLYFYYFSYLVPIIYPFVCLAFGSKDSIKLAFQKFRLIRFTRNTITPIQ
ncbi:unnamed protein product [Didymodactylos carnosus]|uniref:G-protein coupled receptors family 1 profile domain-containing protein n=1 Tax=Didymodactylos carnosus TaxID=1234261 RepID=A0A815ZHE5_9BILA|nr:unnamed protein product [Didymodactylos carnosus]CAF4453875.1 unnamed protein product [Didymodactylos carnosus]